MPPSRVGPPAACTQYSATTSLERCCSVHRNIHHCLCKLRKVAGSSHVLPRPTSPATTHWLRLQAGADSQHGISRGGHGLLPSSSSCREARSPHSLTSLFLLPSPIALQCCCVQRREEQKPLLLVFLWD